MQHVYTLSYPNRDGSYGSNRGSTRALPVVWGTHRDCTWHHHDRGGCQWLRVVLASRSPGLSVLLVASSSFMLAV
jgi:hypothetical protein